MKKYIYHLFMLLLATATMTSCAEEEGTEPGNDSNPAVIVYQYKASRPNNPDNDVVIRFATNSRTTEAYYLAETAADKNKRIASLGKEGYMDYVVSNGTKVADISGASNVDVILTDLYGEITITAVAVGDGAKTSSETTFTGLAWTDVASGTYHFTNQSVSGTPSATISGMASIPTVLQVCTTDANLYRFTDVFGKGYHLKINLIDIKGSDAGGEYQFFRIPSGETSFVAGKNGPVSVRDVGYWQGDDTFVTEGGYESGIYANHECFLFITYHVTAGVLGYGYDSFIPN